MDDRFSRNDKPEGQEVRVSQDSLGNPVLLHSVALDANSSPKARQALLSAAQAAVSFRHPQVLAVREVRLEGDSLVFVQDYPLGLLLADTLLQGGRMPPTEALAMMRQFASALVAAQAKGLTLSQICPTEFVVQEASGELLCLCPPVPAGWWLEVEDPVFSSPEQKIGQACDIRSTMYSAGAMLGVMVTGERCLSPEGWNDALSQAGLPPKVNQAIKAVLTTDPAKRCASPRDWMALLDKAIGTKNEPARQPAAPRSAATPALTRALAPSFIQMGDTVFTSPAENKARRGLLPLLATLGIALVALGAWQFLPKEAPSAEPGATGAAAPAQEPGHSPPTASEPSKTTSPAPVTAPPPAPVIAEAKAPPMAPAVAEPKIAVAPAPEPGPKPPVIPPSPPTPEAKPAPATPVTPEPAKMEAKADPAKKPATPPSPPVPEAKPAPATPVTPEPPKMAVAAAPESAPKPPATPPSPAVPEAKPAPVTPGPAKADPAPTPKPAEMAAVAEIKRPLAVIDPPPAPPQPAVKETKPGPATKAELLEQAAKATGQARSELYRKVLETDAKNPQALHGLVEAAVSNPPIKGDEVEELSGWADQLESIDDPLGSHALGCIALQRSGAARSLTAAIKSATEAIALLKQSLHASYAGSFPVLAQACIDLHSFQLQNREKPKADRTSKALVDEIESAPDNVPAKEMHDLALNLENLLKERAAKGPPRMQEAFLKLVMQHLYAKAAERGDDEAKEWVKTHR